ncbi:MAG: enolase C-terminal domain-like protein [Rhodospirillales bacterium]
MQPAAAIEDVRARCFRIPTETPEADGTLAWDSTTLVLVEASAGGRCGLGYAYADAAARSVVQELLAGVAVGQTAFDIPRLNLAMTRAVRNLGRAGVCAGAISAVDAALWDLKAKLIGIALVDLLGRHRDEIAIYGSGGFTSEPDDRLERQLAGWVADDGCAAVKMKVGSRPDDDRQRVRRARGAIGAAALYIDANGALARKQALDFAAFCHEFGVAWFEEPVSSDDLAGLRLLRDRAPPGMEIAAGEYGYDAAYFRTMLEAQAVDVVQADATRCGGITGFMQVAAVADAFMVPLSAHTAPALHCHPACAAPRMRNVEWFYDHVRIERMLFEGAPLPQDGAIRPDRSRPGLGLEFKARDAERYAI